jgi:hypothetical protein
LSDPATDDKHWQKEMGFWRLLLYLSIYD